MRVSIDDVVDLCTELGVVTLKKEEPSPEEIFDYILNEIDHDVEGFLVSYTRALLKHIEIGTSNLTGTPETYKGFGIRNGSIVTMILKTEVKT